MNMNLADKTVAVIGLGYVGMPLAVMLSKYIKTIGFDISEARVSDLQDGVDSNREVEREVLEGCPCVFTSNLDHIKSANIYIITVPTPIDAQNNPDLSALRAVSSTVGGLIQKGDVIVYESTVYPGVTEDVCGRILEEVSGLISGVDFFLGYSPERINPGDAKHTVENITKVVSAQTPEVTDLLASLYGSMNNNNIFKAKNIKTAEAAKAIENAQRDINVAFVNEVTMILNKIGLSSHDVLETAKTKWNFLPFVPGLVGGHCISVDPFYLAQCAKDVGYDPQIILSGRKINDNMGAYIGECVKNNLTEADKGNTARDLALGFTFKEDINDIRNTKTVDVIRFLKNEGYDVDIHDPHAIAAEVKAQYGFNLINALDGHADYDAVVLLVAHSFYKDMPADVIQSKLSAGGFIYDIKGIWREREFQNTVKYKAL